MSTHNIRKAKLHYKSVPRIDSYITVPWINLSGHWLAKAGFRIGDNITIIIKRNSLQIKKSKGNTQTFFNKT
ncbi:Toxin SymE, type I toxin-antitoxin system [Chitinophaga eiseniae]|uniref:Toxin SymE, type I toxin-antitoxin system n=2 Tax=Chitinophaga eiseniae TaxID=634771 RepID=A0A1T4MMC9_9BACT|nr:Toxin SymE, type I toxin-antitoxin system [Chitinophaga eiseniae]